MLSKTEKEFFFSFVKISRSSVIFCGEYLKSLVYADKPQMLDYWEINIRRVIADIKKDT